MPGEPRHVISAGEDAMDEYDRTKPWIRRDGWCVETGEGPGEKCYEAHGGLFSDEVCAEEIPLNLLRRLLRR